MRGQCLCSCLVAKHDYRAYHMELLNSLDLPGESISGILSTSAAWSVVFVVAVRRCEVVWMKSRSSGGDEDRRHDSERYRGDVQVVEW